MKILTKTLLATALTCTLLPMIVQASDRVVVLSDAMPEAKARMVLTQAKRLMAAMTPGDTLTFVNGRTTEQVAGFALPSGAAGEEILASKRKSAKFFGPSLKTVQDYIVATAQTVKTLDEDDVPLQVNLPGMLQSLTLKSDQKPDVVFFGTMRYHDNKKMPGYSMAHSFPNDAHFSHSPSSTPYGAAGMGGVLAGTHVHFCHMDTEDLKEIHRLGLERATGLLVQGYGATFATSASSVSGCVDHALAGKVDKTKTYIADKTQKVMVNYDVNLTGRVPTVREQEQNDLFSKLKLSDEDKETLWSGMQKKQVVLAEVKLYDTQATDGDVIALVSGKVRFTVALTKTKKTVIVPITNGSLKIVGVRDGQGGITVGVQTKHGDELISPVMRVGETIELPFVKLST